MVSNASSSVENKSGFNFQMVASLLAAFFAGVAPHHSRPISKNKRKREVFEPNAKIYESETDRRCREEIDRLFDDTDTNDQIHYPNAKLQRMGRVCDVSGTRTDYIPWNYYPAAQAFEVEGVSPIFLPTYTKPEWETAVKTKEMAVKLTREEAVEEIAAMKYFIDIDFIDDDDDDEEFW